MPSDISNKCLPFLILTVDFYFSFQIKMYGIYLRGSFSADFASLLFSRAKRFTDEIFLPPANYKMELSFLTVQCRPLEQKC